MVKEFDSTDFTTSAMVNFNRVIRLVENIHHCTGVHFCLVKAQKRKRVQLLLLFFCFVMCFFFFLCVKKIYSLLCLSPLHRRQHSGDVHLLELVSVVGVQLVHVCKGSAHETEDAEGSARRRCAVPSHAGLRTLYGTGL